MPTENGDALLPEGSWVGSYSYGICDEVLYFGVYNGSDAREESETLIIFADGYTILSLRISVIVVQSDTFFYMLIMRIQKTMEAMGQASGAMILIPKKDGSSRLMRTVSFMHL